MLLKAFKSHFIKKSSGAAQPNYSKEKIVRTSAPLPPLAEQRRIVSKVEGLMSLCDTLEDARRARESVRERASRSVLASLTSAPRVGVQPIVAGEHEPAKGSAKACTPVQSETLKSAWHRLSDHFEVLLDQPETVPHLRQSILQLAVQGKLVPQDPSDEPVSELRINLAESRRSEWEELEFAKLCARKKKPEGDKWKGRLKVVSELSTENLSDLPNGWMWVPVEEAGAVQLGRQRAPKYASGPNMKPYLRVQNVHEARICLADVKEMNFDEADTVTFRLRHSDILLNEGQSTKLVGRPAIYRDEVPGVCFQNTLVRFRHYNGVLPEYALLVFRHYMRGRFQEICQQTTNIAHLGASRFAALEFPLPPSAEQKRIVSKVSVLLSQCDELSARLVSRQSTTDALLTALIHQILH